MVDADVKILLQDGENIETLWATPVGEGEYQLDNSPFWAYGVSWKDVVAAAPDSDGQLAMTHIVRKSGHRTVRVIFEEPAEPGSRSQAILDGAVALGCSYEGMHPKYLVLDLPAGVDLMRVATYLTEHRVQWEHADPRYADLYPDRE